VILLTDLNRATVRTLDGRVLGRVHEVHCDGGQIVALMCGPASFIERLTARKKGRRIPWEYVKKLDSGEVTVVPDPPQQSSPKKASGSRTLPRTPRPSARRSKR
jgi:sporulation protein YlmC with PRC-barrel domain